MKTSIAAKFGLIVLLLLSIIKTYSQVISHKCEPIATGCCSGYYVSVDLYVNSDNWHDGKVVLDTLKLGNYAVDLSKNDHVKIVNDSTIRISCQVITTGGVEYPKEKINPLEIDQGKEEVVYQNMFTLIYTVKGARKSESFCKSCFHGGAFE